MEASLSLALFLVSFSLCVSKEDGAPANNKKKAAAAKLSFKAAWFLLCSPLRVASAQEAGLLARGEPPPTAMGRGWKLEYGRFLYSAILSLVCIR